MLEKKKEAKEVINDSIGFFLLSTKEVEKEATELSVMLNDISPSEIAQGIDWVLQTYPEVIEFTLFGSGAEEEKPNLGRMN